MNSPLTQKPRLISEVCGLPAGSFIKHLAKSKAATMTPRPPTHREPTDEEMQCLPEGTLVLCTDWTTWQPSVFVGEQAPYVKDRYAIPITKHEEIQEPRKTLRDEFAMAAMASLILKTPSVRIFDSDENMDAKITWSKERFMPGIAAGAYGYADAMLAARNNQPEKV